MLFFAQIKITKQLVDVIVKLIIGRSEKFKTNPHFVCVGGGGVEGGGGVSGVGDVVIRYNVNLVFTKISGSFFFIDSPMLFYRNTYVVDIC